MIQKAGGRMQLIPFGWWVCRYFDGEELAFGLGEKMFKTKVAGNGWVLGALNKGQPEEIAPFCKVAVEAKDRKKATRRGRRKGQYNISTYLCGLYVTLHS